MNSGGGAVRVRRGHCHVAARPATFISILAADFNELPLTRGLNIFFNFS